MAWIELTGQEKKFLVNTDQVVRIAPVAEVNGGGTRLYTVAERKAGNEKHTFFDAKENLQQIEAILARAHITVGR